MARFLRIALTFVGIVALFPIGALAWFSFTQSTLYLNMYGVHDSAGFVITFNDLDADGVRESSEPPLPGVCILSGYRPDPPQALAEANPCHYEDYQVTNEQGVWEKFLPGGDCTGLYAFAVPPAGFQSTNTPAARACSAEFGFVQEGTVVKNRFPTSAQFASREKTTALLGQLAIAIVVLGTASVGSWLLNKPRPDKPSTP